MRRRVTIEDVARAAGVSRQTVSRAINNKDEISPDTMKRVMEAVQRLGFRPSRVAQGLATQRTYTIGVVVPDITNPFFPEIARGMQDVARAKEYNVFLCNTDESPEQELQVLYSLAAQPVDGIALFGSRISDDELAAFADQYQPLVVFNRWLESAGVSLVLVDNHKGAELAVAHLVNRGHRLIGMLAGPAASPSSVQRVEGFRQAMDRRGLPVVGDVIVPGPPTVEGGYDAASGLLTQHPETTAVFAYNDLMALGTAQLWADRGCPVPGGCAVIGFDDIRLSSMVSPSLTTIYVDKYEVGRQSMSRLLAMFDDTMSSFPPIEIDVDLVVRESAP